jgi:hypothetical protein
VGTPSCPGQLGLPRQARRLQVERGTAQADPVADVAGTGGRVEVDPVHDLGQRRALLLDRCATSRRPRSTSLDVLRKHCAESPVVLGAPRATTMMPHMANPPAATGELYSLQYIERGKPTPDSARFRARLAQFTMTELSERAFELRAEIILETGAPFGFAPNWPIAVQDFINKGELVDVLNSITVIYRYLHKRSLAGIAERWRLFVQRALKEEGVAYTIDAKGGMHPLIDVEFSRNVTSAIAGLSSDSRYGAARTAFAAAEEKFRQVKPDTKGAIRDVFEAAETLTKLISKSGKGLDSGFVRTVLEPEIRKRYTEAVAQRSILKSAQSFADWIDSVHPYRHGHEAEEPIAPPMELAVLIVSQGASFIRWLVELDAVLTARGLV